MSQLQSALGKQLFWDVLGPAYLVPEDICVCILCNDMALWQCYCGDLLPLAIQRGGYFRSNMPC